MYRFLPILTVLCLFANTVCAQISDSLYNALPDSVKPAHKNVFTPLERQNILAAAGNFAAVNFKNELWPMAAALKDEIKQADDIKIKIEKTAALAAWYNSYSIDSSLIYNKILLGYINKNPLYDRLAASAYLMESTMYNYHDELDSAVDCLHESQRLAQDAKDSLFLSGVYNTYCILYARLKLYKSSLYYGTQMLQSYPVLKRWNTNEYVVDYLTQAIHYALFYKQNNLFAYRDSAYSMVIDVMKKKQQEAPHWFEACYYFLGYIDYLDSNYTHAIKMFDSSMLPLYNLTSFYDPNNYFGVRLYKAVCLIKLGQYQQGRQLFESLNLGAHNYGQKQLVYQTLSEGAEAHGDFKPALQYHKLATLYADSLNIDGQRGKVFELEQQYQGIQKQARISSLENQALKNELERNQLIIAATVIVLLLAMLAVYFYQRAKRQKQQKKLELLQLRKTISANIHDEVSSGIAALRFLISDLKARAETEEVRVVLEDIEEETNAVYVQSRNLMHQINNDGVPDDYNVAALLDRLQGRFGKHSSVKVVTIADSDAIEKYFTPQQNAAVYRIINEALTNTLKHSKGDVFIIELHKRGKKFYFELKDNGCGLPQSNLKEGLGLASIKQRVKEIKGQVAIKSSTAGVVITGSFPIV